MVRRVFFSFHYQPDNWRASQVRNIGVIEGNRPATDNDWETVKRGGGAAIKRWIAGQMRERSCTVVLIGAATAGRKWTSYEIAESWNARMGVLGIYVHNLKDRQLKQTRQGRNPFAEVAVSGKRMSSIVKAYNPPFKTSTSVYAHIQNNIESWIEEALVIRRRGA